MYLADEFYLIAHQDSTGKPRLHAKPTGTGTAAALLAELYLSGNITIDEHDVIVVSAAWPHDRLTVNVLDNLLGGHRRAVRDWLAFLSRTAVQDVADRLTYHGFLEKVETRRPWGAKQLYVPKSMNDAAWPRARITARLIGGAAEELSLPDQILVGLCFATGLTRQMLWDEERQAGRRYLAQVIGDLPPPMRTLVVQTQIAVHGRAGDLA